MVIYPNPVENELFINSGQPIEKVEISDISGRTVRLSIFWKYGKSNTIDVSHLPKDVYFAKIFVGNQSITKKIIKE